MLPKVLSFVDVETTGMSPKYDRIIEIGIIRVEDNQIIDQFSTLVNPDIHIDPFILSMTGISLGELKNAPSFYEISKRIKELLSDSLFIAHNVSFDYFFVKGEFDRIEKEFNSKYCCSVKLSRNLFPRFKHHNLDAIIRRFNFDCKRRHRALDDAKVIWDFYQLSLKKFGQEKVLNAFSKIRKRPSLPVNISEKVLDSLPELPGVYIFYNQENAPLYIGKSRNIRNRVLAHFSGSKRVGVDTKIVQDVARIEAIETAGELGALLLEATLVKKFQPFYNRKLRYAAKLLVLKKVVTADKYNSVSAVNLEEIPVEDLSGVLGIFKSKKDLKVFLLSLSKEYKLCPKLLGWEKGSRNCFNFHLGFCYGACSGGESYLKYNLRFDEAFCKTKIKEWPFKGPVAVKEKSGREDIFIIDKWCVLGKLKNDSDSVADLSRDYLFDTDTYKILNRFLSKKGELEIFNINLE